MNGFAGKYRLQGAGGLWITMEAASWALGLAEPPGENSRFNFYKKNGAYVIQAMNGCYITEDGQYKALLQDSKDAPLFFMERCGQKAVVIYMVLADNCRAYFNSENGQLRPLIKQGAEELPNTAKFTCLQLSYGFSQLKAEGAKGMDLDWVDFSGFNMRRFDLRQSNARQANFNRADLSSALLQTADFTGSTFTSAKMRDIQARLAKFEDCVLRYCCCLNMGAEEAVFQGADLYCADLRNASFTRADFSNASLEKCRLNYAAMAGVNLQGANLAGAEMPMVSFAQIKTNKDTVFNEVFAERSNFRFQNLAGVSFAHADLRRSYFDGADLTGADLSYADLEGSSFCEDAILSGASLANSRLAGANFTGAQLGFTSCGETPAADLTGAYMPDAVMRDANLNGVNMSGVNWYGTNATAAGAHMELINFSNAVLATMKFTQADLYGCTFDYANLICTNFRGAKLRPASNHKAVSFAYANIQGADFFESEMVNTIFSNAAPGVPVHCFFAITGEDAQNCARELNKGGTLAPKTKALFQANGLSLPDDAVSQVYLLDHYWRIQSKEDCLYVLTMEYGEIQVRGGMPGVRLFTADDADGSIRAELEKTSGQMPEKLSAAFSEAGYKLNSCAAVAGSADPGQSWMIDNDLHDETKLQRGYLEFLAAAAGDKQLAVYGTMLGTVRVGEDQTYEQQRDVILATKWIPDLLQGDSICPCGQNISVVSDLRPAVRMTWDETLIANKLPKEPECIPDPFHWCQTKQGGSKWR